MTGRGRRVAGIAALLIVAGAAFVWLQRGAEDPVDHGPAAGAAADG